MSNKDERTPQKKAGEEDDTHLQDGQRQGAATGPGNNSQHSSSGAGLQRGLHRTAEELQAKEKARKARHGWTEKDVHKQRDAKGPGHNSRHSSSGDGLQRGLQRTPEELKAKENARKAGRNLTEQSGHVRVGAVNVPPNGGDRANGGKVTLVSQSIESKKGGRLVRGLRRAPEEVERKPKQQEQPRQEKKRQERNVNQKQARPDPSGIIMNYGEDDEHTPTLIRTEEGGVEDTAETTCSSEGREDGVVNSSNIHSIHQDDSGNDAYEYLADYEYPTEDEDEEIGDEEAATVIRPGTPPPSLPAPAPAPAPSDTIEPEESAEDANLVEARPVAEEPSLMQAQPVDHEEEERKKKERLQKRRQLVTRYACAAVVVIVIAVVLGVVLGRNKPTLVVLETNITTNAPTLSPAPSSVPSSAPTTISEEFLSSLPNYTQDSLLDPFSAQFRAFDWLSRQEAFPIMENWRRRQLMALASFYYSFDGENWPFLLSDDWLVLENNKSECDWHSNLYTLTIANSIWIDPTFVSSSGIGELETCNEFGEFVSLALISLFPRSSSQRVMPREIGLLSSMSFLSLTENQINASLSELIPAEIAQLSNLRFLYLDGDSVYRNQFIDGTIPTYLGKLSSLLLFDISWNMLEGTIPTEIFGMTSLYQLYLDRNERISGTIPSEIGRLKDLVFLDLGHTDLTGSLPSEISELPNLFYLHLPCRVTLPKEGMQSLLPNLRDFAVQGGTSCNNTNAFPMDQYEKDVGLVTVIDLSFRGLQGPIPTEIGKLTGLTQLMLHGNLLTGSIPSELGLCTRLMNLNLGQNLLGNTIPSVIGSLLQLLYMDLSSNFFTGQIPDELFSLTNIWVLQLNSNHLNGTIPSEFNDSHPLMVLDLAFNNLTGRVPSELGMASSLVKLDLKNNILLTGFIPSELGKLGTNIDLPVARLSLSNTSLTGAIPLELGIAVSDRRLVEFNITGTQVVGAIPPEMCFLEDPSCFWADPATGLRACHLNFDCTSFLCGCNCTCTEI